MKFQYLRKDSSLKLVVFSDSSMENLPDSRWTPYPAYGCPGWKILTYMLPVKEDQEISLKHFS